MKKYWLVLIVLLILGAGAYVWHFAQAKNQESDNKEMSFSDVEAGFEDTTVDESVNPTETPATSTLSIFSTLLTRGSRWAYYWKEFSAAEMQDYGSYVRPNGPPHVGIQVGHWKNTEVPEELSGLTKNGGGATGGGKTEVDTMLIIAKKVKTLLEARGVIVDLLPATVPEDYIVDAFVSIHADGSTNSSVSGFKIASPQTDFSGKSVALVDELAETYKTETKLSEDSNITRRMSAYYAFNWRRYQHAVHPLTPSAIIETGFMTSSKDRAIIVSNPDKAAKGIADGIINFLEKTVPENVRA